MTSPPPSDAGREYFMRVMETWKLRAEEGHPYAQNLAWQAKLSALRSWIQERIVPGSRVLEVGCGTGLLQDEVERYFGIDIAETSAPFMRKPFCVSSATRLPFKDDSFEAVWSIWVLEHIQQPELMLSEMRRVVRPGGSIFLCAAFGVDSWVSQGIHKRPFRELSMRQRLTKLTLPVRSTRAFKAAYVGAHRLADLAWFAANKRPTPLRYKKLRPNYDVYWDYDADAVASLDAYNVHLYFLSRGDRSEYGRSVLSALTLRSDAQAFTVRK